MIPLQTADRLEREAAALEADAEALENEANAKHAQAAEIRRKWEEHVEAEQTRVVAMARDLLPTVISLHGGPDRLIFEAAAGGESLCGHALCRMIQVFNQHGRTI